VGTGEKTLVTHNKADMTARIISYLLFGLYVVDATATSAVHPSLLSLFIVYLISYLALRTLVYYAMRHLREKGLLQGLLIADFVFLSIIFILAPNY
jgi:hypothetical protein